jgi:hypothetical protein
MESNTTIEGVRNSIANQIDSNLLKPELITYDFLRNSIEVVLLKFEVNALNLCWEAHHFKDFSHC